MIWNQIPADHIGEPWQVSQLCPCYQCKAQIGRINEALAAVPLYNAPLNASEPGDEQ